MKKSIIYTTQVESPLGEILLTATDSGLCGLYFHDQRYLPKNHDAWIPEDSKFKSIRKQLAAYFSGKDKTLDVPLDIVHGTPFQRQVWEALKGIGPGQTRTYAQLACDLGRPKAVRAVGAAVGRNPLSLIVPCHRVIGTGGSLTGYAGGLDRKRWLLAHEMKFGNVNAGEVRTCTLLGEE